MTIYNRTNIRNEQKTAAGLADSFAKDLTVVPDATDKKDQSEAEQHGGQDGAEDGSPDDGKLALFEENVEHDDFDDRAETGRRVLAKCSQFYYCG